MIGRRHHKRPGVVRHLAVAACAGLLSLAGSSKARGDGASRLLDLIDTRQGTESNIGLSHGATLPLVGPPWPMTQWAPQTFYSREWFENGGWWFQPSSKQVYGFRATHQPSPWMGDYGQFSVMPQTGPLQPSPEHRAAAYDATGSTFRPDYVRMPLTDLGIDAELTASERCGVMRFTFNHADVGRMIFDPARVAHLERVDARTIRGYTTANNGGVPDGWRAYFVAHLDRDMTAFGVVDPDGKADASAQSIDGDRIKAYVEFATAGTNRAVTLTIATSFIGYDQAERNLQNEAADGFDAVRHRTADAWERNLARVQIKGGTDEQRRTFYSCLYRAQTFPHELHEPNADGKPIHFSVYDGKVHDGPAYGDIGFWDVYRTDFPLWSILFPERLSDILNGLVTSSRENNGWIAQWPSPGNRGGMIGTHTDAVFADAVAKDIGGFDRDAAYAAIRKDAFDTPPNWGVGRGDLADYQHLGFVPAQKTAGYSVSATLDYAYDDWCVAQVARSLGRNDDADVLMKRSTNYRNLWDPAVGFFRPKRADGSWFTPTFDEFAWSTGNVEGGPWQCTWAVPHDVEGLAKLMGGKPTMRAKLDRMMGLPPIFHVGEYPGVIHEMAEMANAHFGQYDQGNQPVHNVLYLFAALGEPAKTQYWTRRVCQELFNPGPTGFAGDEDNGEQSSWYVLSSLGLYQPCVGAPTYTLTSPLFDEATLSLANGKTFTIRAKDNAEQNVYVQRRTLDGQPFNGETIDHARLMQGGTLEVDLGPLVPGAK